MESSFEQNTKPEIKERPEVLYVSAQTKGIKELTPMSGRHRGGNEGSVIFSTPDKALASVFLVKDHDDSWMQIGYFSGVPYTIIRMDRDEFIKRDTGGVMYTVPSDTFDFNPNLGMREKEWTSREPVKPLDETLYSSALDTMIDNGVNVYFVDQDTFDLTKKAQDHGFLLLLQKLTSENQKRGKVLKPLQNIVKQ